MSETSSKKPLVAVIKGKSPEENYLEGIEKLGGISQYIEEGDNVFLKITLRVPMGYPMNSNFDLVKEVIISCKKAGANKIYVGSFSSKEIALKIFNDLLGLESYFKALGAEFVYLDNSDYYIQKSNNQKLGDLKANSLKDVNIGEKKIQVPEVITNSNKIIVINQVNVNPLFMCDLSLINYYSVLPAKFRDINYGENVLNEEIVKSDLFRQDLISNILNTYAIKKPILTINDVFYILEEAGPFIYRDSNLKKTNVLIMGTDLISVDAITLRFLGFDVFKNDLVSKALERSLGPEHISDIKLLGEDLGKISIDINQCFSHLEDIKIPNIFVSSGNMCSGCFLRAYHLLNFMNSRMIKDVKNLPNQSLLVGLNPPEALFKDHVILFGDCAIKSTKNYKFRTKTKKTLLRKKEMQVKNKNILTLSGCPPNINDCLKLIFEYYDKSDLPNLNYLIRSLRTSNFFKYSKKLKKWEDL